MKTVLCFGDSNTFGTATAPRPDGRYGSDERWPGVLRAALGAGWSVVEAGLPGRTTVHADPIEGPWMDGSAYLLPCLRSHRPLDLVVIMLGTNDLKARFAVPAGDIAGGIGVLLQIVERAEAGRDGGVPRTLVICPPTILENFGERPDFADMFAAGREKSLRLPPLYRAVATEHGAAFLNAGELIACSPFDGIHLDADAHAKLGAAVAEIVAGLAT
jgi:lysophospholipase L1-like esterase